MDIADVTPVETPATADGAEKAGQKRKSPWVPPPKGEKRSRRYTPNSKTPAMVLTQYFNGKGQWDDSMVKDLDRVDDLYVFSVTIGGVEYFGKANSKKVARQAACECALRHSGILSEKEASEVIWLLPPPPAVTDDLPEDRKLALRTLLVPELTKTLFAQKTRACLVSELRKKAPLATFDVKENPLKVPQKKTDSTDGVSEDVEIKDGDSVAKDEKSKIEGEGEAKGEEPKTEGVEAKPKKKASQRYMCTITIPGLGEFSAVARSKPLARQKAAWVALKDAYKVRVPAPGKGNTAPVLKAQLTKPNPGEPPAKMMRMGVSPFMAPGTPPVICRDPTATPASILNVTRPGLTFEYDIDEIGTKTCKCVVDGLEFVGRGNSKKDAKQDTCRRILQQVFNVLVGPEQGAGIGKQESAMTPLFPVRQECMMPLLPVKQNPGLSPKKGKLKAPKSPNDDPQGYIAYASEKISALTLPKQPVALVSEIYKDVAEFKDMTAFDEKNKPVGPFQIALKIFGRQFFGQGPNKKMAKTGACRAALAAIHGMSFSPVDGNCLPPAAPIKPELQDFTSDTVGLEMGDVVMFDVTAKSGGNAAPASVPNYPRATAKLIMKQGVADAIADAVNTKFKEITADDQTAQKRKVLAGIVLTLRDVHGPDFDPHDRSNFKVLCVTSGTKCVSGGGLGLVGDVVQDCHAEILAKRCMRLFFMEEMRRSMTNQQSIFEQTMGGVFKLKDGVQFHLYISSAPCGDARIFCVQEQATETTDAGFSRKNRGLLRTKVESGEGTIPISGESMVQTYDAIVGGQRMLTMSCSDKLCRWNVTGLQGALLAQLLERPIYLSSVVLGSLFQPEHLERALIDRVSANLDELPRGYNLNKPLMGVWSSPETRTVIKSPNHSVNWIDGFGNLEMLNAMTGKIQLSSGASSPPEPSRLCKASMFSRWRELWIQVTGTQPLHVYGSAKALAYSYQDAKEAANQSLFNGGFSRWVKKPPEVDSFGRE